MTGKTMTVKAVADTLEEAFAQARAKVPDNTVVLEERELASPSSKTITIEAFDEQTASWSAKSQATSEFGNTAIVKDLTRTLMGQKGFFGIGKKPHQYEAELVRRAAVEIDYRTIPPNVEELRATGDVEGLARALNYREDDAICQAALTALSEMGHAKDAVKALKMIQGPHVVELLAQVLKDSDADVRILAVQELAKDKQIQAIKAIIAALNDPDSRVRNQAAHSLQTIGTPAVRPLIAALKHKDKNVRESAINALGNIGDAQVLKALIGALGDKDPDVRKAVPMALGNSAALLRNQQGGSLAPISQAANALVSVLGKGDRVTRDQIVMTLTLLSGEDYGYDVVRWKLWAEKLSSAVVNQILSKTDVGKILSEYR